MSKSRSKPESSQLNRALSVLNKIGQTLTAIEDPTEVLRQIAIEAKDALEADIVDLYEYNQVRHVFTLPPVLVGERRDPYVPKHEIFNDDVVFKVVNAGKPQYFPFAQKAEQLIEKFEVSRPDTPDNRFVIREGVLSSVSLPLQVGMETVGVMFVNYRTSQEFGDEQKGLIESFSNLAGIAIYNSRLWKLQNSQLAALKEIIDIIGAENPLETILEQAVSLFSANHGSIGRLNENGQHLKFKSQKLGEKVEDATREDLFNQPAVKGITGYVVQSGKPFRTGNVSEVEFYIQRYPSTKSEMAIPLKNAFGGVIGVLNLESDLADFFTQEHEKLCVSFANAAAAAVQQSDLIENVQSLHALTEWHNVNDLLNEILTTLIKMMGANTASSVNLYDKESDKFYSFYGIGPNQLFVDKYLLVPPREDGTGRYVLKTRNPLYYDDVKNIQPGLPPIRKEAWDQGILSFAVLPLIFQDEILGTLFIHKFGQNIEFTEDARRILETYAAETALAIHNNRHRIEAEPLKEILSATASEGLEKILNMIAEKAVLVMASDYASIWLAEKETGDLVRQALYIKPEEESYLNLKDERIKSSNQSSINMSVYKTGNSMVISDVRAKEEEGLFHRIYQKAKSEITVPLMFHDEIIGTLNTESQYLGAYSELDVATFRLFADVATSAVKVAQGLEYLSEANSRITAEVERKTQELNKSNKELYYTNFRLERKNNGFEALTLLSQQLTANVKKGESEILKLIHQRASKLMDTNNMYIALYEPKKKMVSFGLAFVDGKSVDVQNQKGWEPRSGGHGRTEWIISKKTPILNYTKEDAENWYKQPDTQEYIGETFSSWLGVPIMFGDEVMGVIATYNKTEERKYSPDDLEVLALMGRQAAIALQNARLISELDERVEELDKIRELGEDLNKGIQ